MYVKQSRISAVIPRSILAASLALSVGLGAPTALAYPTSVVFAPTGEAKAGGDVSVFLYQAMSFAPTVGPAAAWIGVDVGLIPRVPYGKSGLSFGGLEVGIDAFAADLYGTPDAYVKPIFNAKLQFVTEGKWMPHIAVGAMQVNPFRLPRSMNMVYGSMTKTLLIAGRNFGRLTLGMGSTLINPGDDPYKDSYPVYYATAPFPRQSRLFLLGGYESPSFGPFNIGLDHIGGTSEVGSTNLVLNMTPFDGATFGLGGYAGSDPKAFYGGMFAYIFLSFNIFKTFRKKDKPAPVAPAVQSAAPAPAPAP
jgi:hypothetical protein